MPKHTGTCALHLRILDPIDSENVVDAEFLARILEGIQRLMYLIGMSQENVKVASRSRLPRQIERLYRLRCRAALEAADQSFHMLLGDPFEQAEDAARVKKAGKTFEQVLVAIEQAEWSVLKDAIPEDFYRQRMLEAIRGIVPKPGSRKKVALSHNGGAEKIIESSAWHRINSLIAQRGEEVKHTITGRLTSINYLDRKLTLLYPVTERELECVYDPSLEELLIEHRHEWIQVTGTVILGPDHEPVKLTNVENIVEHDLSEFEVESVQIDDATLLFDPVLFLTPETTESKQLMYVEDEELGIDVYATTRDELWSEIQEQIKARWTEYALEEDEKLTKDARKLKNALLKRAKAISKCG